MDNPEVMNIIERNLKVLKEYSTNTSLSTGESIILSYAYSLLIEVSETFKHHRIDCDKIEKAYFKLGFILGILFEYKLSSLEDFEIVIGNLHKQSDNHQLMINFNGQ